MSSTFQIPDKSTFSDFICEALTQQSSLQSRSIAKWLTDNGYDSDTILQDTTDLTESNIARHFGESIATMQTLQKTSKATCCPLVKVVGISGCTRSGKSTLTKALKQRLGDYGCCSVHQDDHFHSKTYIDDQLSGNWDRSDAIKHDSFYEDIQRIIARNTDKVDPNRFGLECFYVILEGFMLYHDSRIMELVDYPLWVEISKETCIERRMASPNWTHNYWDEGIWQNHEEYKQRTFKNEGDSDQEFLDGMLVLDGTDSKESLIESALKHIGSKSTK